MRKRFTSSMMVLALLLCAASAKADVAERLRIAATNYPALMLQARAQWVQNVNRGYSNCVAKLVAAHKVGADGALGYIKEAARIRDSAMPQETDQEFAAQCRVVKASFDQSFLAIAECSNNVNAAVSNKVAELEEAYKAGDTSALSRIQEVPSKAADILNNALAEAERLLEESEADLLESLCRMSHADADSQFRAVERNGCAKLREREILRR